MNRKNIVVAALVGGALLLGPGVALAQDAAPGKTGFRVSPVTVSVGDTVTASGRCVSPYNFLVNHPAGFRKVADDSTHHDGWKDVKVTYRVTGEAKPGTHQFMLVCEGKRLPAKVTVKAKAPVTKQAAPKQVAKVPIGAAETGAGPEDPASYTGLLAGAGALAVVGGGVWFAARRREHG
ncbi:hypothetical protein [Amycolatopsis suaedae]|uniref:LPXTG cell wall anchor domain-containing protein n=1 Tax=Amycolatopsis suaedae TaxID=2510978 RepID=A0A4V2ELU4_9PSEU|nr:hypothetical protein [Amycolatopsis suaedae]RZQ62775.1 hypothetical protein EWH70_17670 [Amycolatopsis suaedae]